MSINIQERLARHSEVDAATGCVVWHGGKHEKGYGLLTVNKRTVRAHRLAYECFIGPIPKGLQLDHLCRARECVNPAHLEPVTSRENVLRGVSIPATNAAKTHCVRGHALEGKNLAITRVGRRRCRTCHREATRGTYDYQGTVLNRDKTQCKRGHSLSGDNLYVVPKDNRRQCRACIAIRNQAYLGRRRAA